MKPNKQNYKIEHKIEIEKDYGYSLFIFIILNLLISSIHFVLFIILDSFYSKIFDTYINIILVVSLFWITNIYMFNKGIFNPLETKKVIHKIIDIPKKENKK